MASIKAIIGNLLRLDPITNVPDGESGNIYVESTDGSIRVWRDGAWIEVLDSSTGIVDPLTTNGDLIARLSGTTTRLAIGTNGHVLVSDGTVPGWRELTAADIANVATGNLSATDVQTALNELQTDIDTRATDADLTTHEADTAAHGATGAVMGTTNTQTVTKKTIGDQLTFVEQGSDPTAPDANSMHIYAKDSNGISRLYAEDSGGYVTPLSGEVFYIVRNTSGSTISKGQAVYVTGATGATANIALARADAISTAKVLGIVAEDIANNGFGRIISKGELGSFDTSAFSEGDVVYLSETTAGALTATEPSHPDLSVRVGVILVSGVGNGALEVDPSSVEGEDRGTIRNTFAIGDDAAGNKTLEFANGDATRPALRYNDTDNKFQFANDGATWQDFGSGAGGSSGINHIDADSANFETSVGDWVTYADAAASTPVDGTGGTASNISISHETTNPLRGDGSLRITKAAANAQGEGASVIFTIDPFDADNSIPQYVSFDYVASSGYATDDLIPFIYNRDSSALVELRRSGTSKRFTGVFVPDAGDANYRLILHVASTSTTAWTFDVDNVKVGPTAILDVAPKAYLGELTTTGSWTTNTTYTGKYWRDDDWLIGVVKVATAGAPTSAALTLTIPSGLTIDTAKLPSTDFATVLGNLAINDSSTTGYDGIVSYASTTTLSAKVGNSSSATQFRDVTQAVPVTFGSGDSVTLNFRVPITEWANSSALMSTTELMNQSMWAMGNSPTSSPQSIDSGVYKVMDFSDSEDDEFGMFTGTGTSWRANITEAGTYNISAAATLVAPSVLNVGELFILKVVRYNSSDVAQEEKYLDLYEAPTSDGVGTTLLVTLSGGAVPMRASSGDYIRAEIFQNTGSSLSVYGSAGYSWFHIERKEDFTVYGSYSEPNEYIDYTSDAGQSISTSTWTTVVFEDEVQNLAGTHGSYNSSTGIYTAVTQGYREVSASVGFNTTASGDYYLAVYKNGSVYRRLDLRAGTSTLNPQQAAGSAKVYLAAGDTMSIRVYQDSGGSVSLRTDANYNHVEIAFNPNQRR